MSEKEKATVLKKPVPAMDGNSRPFWEGCAQGKLLIKFCVSCQKHHFYPRIICPHCYGEDLVWVEASGEGRIYSYTVAHRPAGEAFREDVPYVIALVELMEGVRMMSNIVGVSPEEVKCEMPVKVVFEEVEGVFFPKFTPKRNEPVNM